MPFLCGSNRAASTTFAGALLLAATAAQAACPTAETVTAGYFLDGSSARSEIRHLDEHFVQAKTRYSDGVVQTDLFYDGIFAVSRVSQRGATMMHDADLEDWHLDLTAGATSSITYVPIVDSKPFPEATLDLEVKNSEVFKLGDCSYTVHVIAQTRTTGGKQRQYDMLYAPLLKFVIARRYPNGDLRAYRGIEVMQ